MNGTDTLELECELRARSELAIMIHDKHWRVTP